MARGSTVLLGGLVLGVLSGCQGPVGLDDIEMSPRPAVRGWAIGEERSGTRDLGYGEHQGASWVIHDLDWHGPDGLRLFRPDALVEYTRFEGATPGRLHVFPVMRETRDEVLTSVQLYVVELDVDGTEGLLGPREPVPLERLGLVAGDLVGGTRSTLIRATNVPGVFLAEMPPATLSSGLIIGPEDLLQRKDLLDLQPGLEAMGPQVGAPVSSEPDLRALRSPAGAAAPAGLVGVKPFVPTLWLAAYDTAKGRRWGALTWEPRWLGGPRWRSFARVRAPSVEAFMRVPEYLVLEEEDGTWLAVLPTAPFTLAAPGAYPTAQAAVNAAEEAMKVWISTRDAAAKAQREREAPAKFDAAMDAHEWVIARGLLLDLPGDAARWTRYVLAHGLQPQNGWSWVTYARAQENGVPADVLAQAHVDEGTAAEPSDLEYFARGLEGAVGAMEGAAAAGAPAGPSGGGGGGSSGDAWAEARQKAYDDTMNRYDQRHSYR